MTGLHWQDVKYSRWLYTWQPRVAQSDNCIFESLNLSEINLFLFSGCQGEDGENTGRVFGLRCGRFRQELPLWCDGLLNLVTSNIQRGWHTQGKKYLQRILDFVVFGGPSQKEQKSEGSLGCRIQNSQTSILKRTRYKPRNKRDKCPRWSELRYPEWSAPSHQCS